MFLLIRILVAALTVGLIFLSGSLGAFATLDHQLAAFRADLLAPLAVGAPLISWSNWPGLAAVIVFIAMLAPRGRYLALAMAAALALTAMACAETLALFVNAQRIAVNTATFHVSVLVLFTLHALHSYVIEYAGRQRAQARLAYLAQHDETTDMLSRRGLIEAVRWELGPKTVVAIELLRLDLVRGALGQQIHHRALKLLGERLGALQLGWLGTIGVDRFALVLRGRLGEIELDRLTQQIRGAIEPALSVDGHVVYANLALGEASGDKAPETLFDRAELALAEAKRLRSRYMVRYSSTLEVAIDRRRRMDAGLRKALAARELKVLYQPQVRLSDGEICGVEALVRWHDPELGTVHPADFIPLAEESGLIVPLGAFVLAEACREAASWNWTGKLAVNVSAAQLQLTEFTETIDIALNAADLAASRLEIEITESMLVDRSGRLDKLIADLHQRGINVAIDDFGTGYSALSYLGSFGFDKLKIDQSFIHGLNAGTAQAEVLRAIIELARRLGKSVLAEGVETDEQHQHLLQMGCDVAQGYLYGRPMTGPDMAAVLRRQSASQFRMRQAHPIAG